MRERFPVNIEGYVLSENPVSFGTDVCRDEEQLHNCSETRGCSEVSTSEHSPAHNNSVTQIHCYMYK
jgi:hypothetical protein